MTEVLHHKIEAGKVFVVWYTHIHIYLVDIPLLTPYSLSTNCIASDD